MDDIVIRGMAKWPNVPAVFGWLALDRRGSWLLKGERIANPSVTGFIGRNYAQDERGRWFFQNGPQRVYVDLEYTPLVYRLDIEGGCELQLAAHSGKRTRAARGAWIDELGALLVDTDLGVGVVNDKDLDIALSAMKNADGRALDDEALERSMAELQHGADVKLYLHGFETPVPVQPIASRDVAQRFGFEPHPRAD